MADLPKSFHKKNIASNDSMEKHGGRDSEMKAAYLGREQKTVSAEASTITITKN